MTDEDLGANKMTDSSDEDSDDEMGELALKGNESFVPNLVEIQDEEGREVFVTQVHLLD
jgi:hypothetical protein